MPATAAQAEPVEVAVRLVLVASTVTAATAVLEGLQEMVGLGARVLLSFSTVQMAGTEEIAAHLVPEDPQGAQWAPQDQLVRPALP
jgi:hypothetical protein